MANQYTSRPKDWDSATIEYRDTPTPAKAIARRVGVSLTYLYAAMNRRGVAKYKTHPTVRAGTRDTYRPALVESAQREDVCRRDAIVLAAHPRFRCGECGALADGPVCPNFHVINPWLLESA